MRSGASSKRKIAEADGDQANTVDQAHAQEESGTQPRMPHTELTQGQLDEQYPSLQVPEDLELDDLITLQHDHL